MQMRLYKWANFNNKKVERATPTSTLAKVTSTLDLRGVHKPGWVGLEKKYSPTQRNRVEKI